MSSVFQEVKKEKIADKWNGQSPSSVVIMNLDRFKFRVWHIHDKEMLYNAEKTYDYGCDGDNEIKDCRFYDLIERHKNGECILMQCTGLKDRNDKLIYEGDILEFSDGIAVVEFENGCFLSIYVKDGEGNPDTWDWKNINILGNIYQNPELVV